MAQRSDLTAQTFLFADLSGFTALTEAHGDEQAADLVGGFCVAVRQLLAAHQAQEVKTIGDALMLRTGDVTLGDLVRHLSAPPRSLTTAAAARWTLGMQVLDVVAVCQKRTIATRLRRRRWLRKRRRTPPPLLQAADSQSRWVRSRW
jgi:class 3 adenylate cyclase